MEQERTLTSERLFEEMLELIQHGSWSIGSIIPSERALMGEFGVSRIAVRESLARLKVLGILDTSNGRRPRVSRLDLGIFEKLFPLMLTFEPDRSIKDVFQVRLALETQSAYLAALHRTEEDLERLDELVKELVSLLHDHSEDAMKRAVEVDLEFHIQIARATQNALFPLLLETIAGMVVYVQDLPRKEDHDRRERTKYSHEYITEAIRDQDAEHARMEMAAHLSFSSRYALKGEKLAALVARQQIKKRAIEPAQKLG